MGQEENETSQEKGQEEQEEKNRKKEQEEQEEKNPKKVQEEKNPKKGQEEKSRKRGRPKDPRFGNPTIRKIMTAILLSPGPVSNVRSVQELSRSLALAVRSSNFQEAATKLEQLEFGVITDGMKNSKIFIKRTPTEVESLLSSKEVEDLCTPEEYKEMFNSAPRASVSAKLKEYLVNAQYVPAEYFLDASGSD